MTKSKFLSSFITAIIATILFALIHEYGNVQLIKKLTEDKAFDYLAKYYLVDERVKTSSPHVMVFGIDNFYFKEQGLLDDDNQTNYGFLFPHDKIVKFIEKIDEVSKENAPKALFIDYDFEFTSSLYGQILTEENLAFIEVLKKKRNYTILLPKTSKYNFIESSSEQRIQALISNKKIVFVSVPLPHSKDGVTRRFIPFIPYKHSMTNQEHNYTSAYVSMWQMFNTERNISKDFKEQEVIENKLIVKNYEVSSYTNKHYLYQQSNWEMLKYYSANYPLERINNQNFSNALILFGRTDGEDSFSVTSSKGKLSGVEVQANALMTLFYFDGKLEKVDISKSVIFVFLLFLVSRLFMHKFLNTLPNEARIFLVKKEFSQLTLTFAFTTMVMALVSMFILVQYQKWFDWNSSLILFSYSSMLLIGIEFIVRLKINLRSLSMKVGVVLVFMVGLGFIFANTFSVKDGNVTVEIDSKEYNLTENHEQKLASGSKICVKDGNGSVLVNEEVLLSKSLDNSCLELKEKKKFDFEAWFKKNMHKVALLFGDDKEQVKLAVTRKGDECEVVTGTMVLKPSDEYLVLKKDCWSPFDIKLEVLDGKDVIYSDVNSKDDETIFIVPKDFLKDDYKVVVYDGLGGEVVNIKLTYQ